MILLYNTGIYLYVAFVYIASLFSNKAALWVNGRKKWKANLHQQTERWTNSIWFHCASLGEFEMIRPLAEKIKSKYPDQKIIITFFSPSGYEVRKNYSYADAVFYLPVDSRSNARYFISCVRPACVVFAKYEFWHYYIDELYNNKIPFYVVSAVFREDHRFFKWYGKFFRRDLEKFTGIFVQDNFSSELLSRINIRSVIAGDTRYDRVIELSSQVKEYPLIRRSSEGKQVIIAGSSWEPEEKALQYFHSHKPDNCFLIIAPHDISGNHIGKIRLLFPGCCLYSEAAKTGVIDSDVLVIDNIGMLSSLYQYSSVAVIGGGFTGKLHNILEAAVYGNAVLFGPLHRRFREAQNLINANGAKVFKDEKEFVSIMNDLFSDQDLLSLMKNNARSFVYENKGAVNIIFPVIEKRFASGNSHSTDCTE